MCYDRVRRSEVISCEVRRKYEDFGPLRSYRRVHWRHAPHRGLGGELTTDGWSNILERQEGLKVPRAAAEARCGCGINDGSCIRLRPTVSGPNGTWSYDFKGEFLDGRTTERALKLLTVLDDAFTRFVPGDAWWSSAR